LTNGGGGGVGFTVQQASAQCVTEERGDETQTECRFGDVETNAEARLPKSSGEAIGIFGEAQSETRPGQPPENQPP
jgi:hypothetical protein